MIDGRNGVSSLPLGKDERRRGRRERSDGKLNGGGSR